jgi:ABC-2 type transport system permease protein
MIEMKWRRSWAVTRNELRMYKDDPGVVVFLIIMPLLMMAVMKPLFALSLQANGFPGATGAEQAVPGMAVMFATFSAGFAGFGFFREYGWRTWDRLRVSSATTLEITVGKLFPVFVISLGQLVALFAIGIAILDLRIRGSAWALMLVMFALTASLLSFGMAITALSRTSLQLNTYANLSGVVFAGVGGALVPIALLPGWVETVAYATPTYWAMEAFRGVILDGNGIAGVLMPTFVLLGFTVLFAVVALTRFRFEETKAYYG